MLTLAPTEPTWIVLFPAAGDRPEVAALFAPIGIKPVRAARRAAGIALQVDHDDVEEAGDELSRELIRRGLLKWRGIGGPDGKPIEPDQLLPIMGEDGEPKLGEDGEPVMQAGIDLFLADPRAYEAADRLYVIPWLERDREGNVSSASPGGTGQVETPAADIASKPATGAPTGDADATAATPKPARTSRTRRGRKKA